MSCRKRRSNDSHLAKHIDDPNRVHRPTPCSLNRSTAEAAAVSGGKVGMTPSERKQVAKLVLWPFVGDTKAASVRPRVGEREIAAARRLMGERVAA